MTGILIQFDITLGNCDLLILKLMIHELLIAFCLIELFIFSVLQFFNRLLIFLKKKIPKYSNAFINMIVLSSVFRLFVANV